MIEKRTVVRPTMRPSLITRVWHLRVFFEHALEDLLEGGPRCPLISITKTY